MCLCSAVWPSSGGRLRRQAYFLRLLGICTLGFAIYALPGLFYLDKVPTPVQLVALTALAVVWYLLLIQVLLRLHDLNLTNWCALVLLLPVIEQFRVQCIGRLAPLSFGEGPGGRFRQLSNVH